MYNLPLLGSCDIFVQSDEIAQFSQQEQPRVNNYIRHSKVCTKLISQNVIIPLYNQQIVTTNKNRTVLS